MEVSKLQNRRIGKSIACVDLFCGAGGLTHGLIRKGIRVVAGIDLDSECRFPYEKNNRNAIFVEKDICDLSGDDIAALYDDSPIRLLAGCAPCQPFSTYSRKGRKVRTDMKWNLVSEFSRLIHETKPDLVTMENVPQLADHEVFEQFLGGLQGYETSWRIVDCTEYGVPQTRKRLVLLASRFGPVGLLPPSQFSRGTQTVREAISHLPPIEAGSSDQNDPVHVACALSDLNLRRIKASQPGGSWRDWDDALLAECHRKSSGQTYPSVYGRMEWDTPAPTVTTQCFGYGNGRFGHPEQNRAISLREAAILQSFPETYQFVSPSSRMRFHVLGRLIGNAVPVRLGELVAESLIAHVRDNALG